MRFDRRKFIAGAISSPLVPAIAQEEKHQGILNARSTDSSDWLLENSSFKARIVRENHGKDIVLTNGLLLRRFRISPNVATVALDNLMNGESVLRALHPEARVTINDVAINVGGLTGQPIQHYLLPEWIDSMKSDPRDLQFTRMEEGKTQERFPWKRVPQWSSRELPWPPPGVSLTFHYRAGEESAVKNIGIAIRYELYDGIPLLSKQILLTNKETYPITLNSFQAEILAINESDIQKIAPGAPNDLLDKVLPLHIETDYAFGGNMAAAQDNPAVQWKGDPYFGEAYYEHQHPSLLECAPPVGPELTIAPGETWQSFTVFELLHDSTEAERRGLAMRRMMATLAPWSQENPILMHGRHSEPAKARSVIDQCAEVGFEMVILSFGSGFNIEDKSSANLEQMKGLADYALSKGIAIGGYSLLASRGGKPQDLVIDVKTDKPGGARFGPSPCLGSKWAEGYFETLRNFFLQTGMNVFENDGSYPGDFCASTIHPGHKGYPDSQWRQWQVMSNFYRWCRGQGIYLTVPDWYFLNGQSKTAMGYTENDWSLPRQYQPLIERQNIYDGTWEKTPSMGWMHVPLMQYHGGGSGATVEPLHENLVHYEMRLQDLFGAGVQAAWRGERLYDTEETKTVVKKWISFYKKYRDVLNSDIIHLRRPDGKDWDGILHVNPTGTVRGLAVIYNPTEDAINRSIRLPLYYTGLKSSASIRIGEGPTQKYKLDKDCAITLSVEVSAKSCTWLSINGA